MAARQEANGLAHGSNLAPQERHLGRRHVIDMRRVQADESTHTDDAAGGVVTLDADEVEVGRAMDRRTRVRLDQNHRQGISGQFRDDTLEFRPGNGQNGDGRSCRRIPSPLSATRQATLSPAAAR
jgi:hypothetical protein